MVAACVSIISGKMAKFACMGLAVLLLAFIVTLHIPAILHAPDEMSRMMPLIGLLKDMSLMGGALVMAKAFCNATKDQVS